MLQFGILDRYILKETAQTWLAVTGVLLLILLANKFARFLGEAASGKLPSDVVFNLLALTSVHYLIVLIPVGLFLGIMLTLGRLYRDSEMAALMACGAGPRELYRPLYLLAILLAIALSGLTLIAGPWSAQASFTLRKNAEQDAQLGQFESGRFKGSRNRAGVFYTETVSADGKNLEHVFMQDQRGDQLVIVTAQTGRQEIDPETGRRVLLLENGYRYDGIPGEASFQQVRYVEHGIDVTPDQPNYDSDKRESVPTRLLLTSNDPRDIAELQWRLSAPLMALVLTLVAVPLARSDPREGKYGRVTMGVLLYVVYSNLLGVSQVWVERSNIPPLVGLWWVHFTVIIIGLYILGRQNGWFRKNYFAGKRA